MNTDRALKFEEYVYYIVYMRNGFIATCSLYENAGIYILNLRHTMFHVHKVTFRYIRILPNLTIQQTIICISFNIVTKLFGVWVVNYEVMALQKWDKCIRGCFLHSKFVMWEHEWKLQNSSIL